MKSSILLVTAGIVLAPLFPGQTMFSKDGVSSAPGLHQTAFAFARASQDAGDKQPCGLRGEPVELSGKYKGIFYSQKNSAGELGELRITGNQFELDVPSGTRSGQIVATKSCGYTAVALRFHGGDKANQTISLTARRIGSPVGFELGTFEAGDRPIVLQTAANQSMDFAFVICPETYPECWPYRKRCPCERPQR